jgi:hypothetical protein
LPVGELDGVSQSRRLRHLLIRMVVAVLALKRNYKFRNSGSVNTLGEPMDSLSMFERTMAHNYNRFRTFVDEVRDSFSTCDMNGIKASAARLAEAGQALSDSLVERDRPLWLTQLTFFADHFRANPSQEHAARFLGALLQRFGEIKPIVVSLQDSPFDFDRLFQQMKSKGRLRELFDKMIVAIEDLIKTKAIDRVTVLNTLRKLLRILKSAREKTLTEQILAFDMFKFMLNLTKQLAKDTPIVGSFVEAISTTVSETDDEIEKLKQETQENLLTFMSENEGMSKQELLKYSPSIAGHIGHANQE